MGDAGCVSFNSSRRKAANGELSLMQRASAARSCALLVAQKFRIPRSTVLALVQQKCGVDLNQSATGEEIMTALKILERLKREGLT